MSINQDDKNFFNKYGYLKYKQVLTEDELAEAQQRSEDIALGNLTHVPERFIQLEKEFRDKDVTDEKTIRLDQVRKMTHLAYFDDVIESIAKNPKIVDVIESLLGTPNIKLYTDQLMMKPRFHGTVTGWHQDSVSWQHFVPQKAVSCWVALDDATVENGCMTVLPGSHKWGPINKDLQEDFMSHPDIAEPKSIEIKAGHCMFHDGLNLHKTGANTTPNRRRGLALHYLPAETIDLTMNMTEDTSYVDETSGLTEEEYGGPFRYMLIRGQEFQGRI